MRRKKWLQLTVAALIGAGAFVIPLGAHAAPASERCVLQVTGELDTGELTTAPIECSSDAFAGRVVGLAAGVIARHYTGYNATGSELDVLGTSCTGGWMNMPPGWTNVIESTYSICTVDHYDLFNLQGTVQRLVAYGGNLTYMSQRTNSVQYS